MTFPRIYRFNYLFAMIAALLGMGLCSVFPNCGKFRQA